MLHALLAFSLSWGTGAKWESSIKAHDEVYALRFSSGLLELEAGIWPHRTGYRQEWEGYRSDIWLNGGPRMSMGSVGFYPYLGLGWYALEPLDAPDEVSSGVLGMAGLSGEWDVPRTHMALWLSTDIVRLFDAQPFDELVWTLGGGLMFRIVE